MRATDPRRSRTLGHAIASFVGRPLAELVLEGERRHLARVIERTRHAPAVWDRVTFRRADGRPEPLLCCFQRLHEGDSPTEAVLVTGLRLASLQAPIQAEAAAALGHLAFTCHSPAHRLMQALDAVMAECPTSRAAHRCREDLDHLLDALSQASAWPKADGGAADAVAVVEAALASVDGEASFDQLRTDLCPESPAAWVTVHPAALAYVTLHLAANARDATAETESPRLRVTVTADDGRVCLEFQDNGRGIGAEERARAFAPCAAGRCGEDGRAGVGLAACRQLLSYFDGSMRIHGRPPEGTTVVVTLPAAEPPP